MVEENNSNSERSRGTLGEVAREFLRLGFVAFGGPAAHVAMMEERFVRRKNWLSRERFLDLFGAASLLPGPSSTELAIYLGELRGGLAGMLVSGASFILPAALMVAALAWVYLRYGSVPQMAGLLFGIKPVAVALMAQAIWNLGRTALRSAWLILLAAAVVAMAVLRPAFVGAVVGRRNFVDAHRAGEKSGSPRIHIHADRKFECFRFARNSWPHFSVLLLSENWRGALWQRLCPIGDFARGPGSAVALVDGRPIVRRDCSQPGNSRPIFYGRNVYRIFARWMEGRRARHTGNVFARICLRRTNRAHLAEIEKLTARQRIYGWSERGSGGADGICRLAVRACHADQCSGDHSSGRQRIPAVSLQSEFGLAGFRRAVAGIWLHSLGWA